MTRAKLGGCLLFVAMLTLPANANSDHIYFESLKDLHPTTDPTPLNLTWMASKN